MVSLQAPEDISIEDIEAQLRQIWQRIRKTGDAEGLSASRAATFSLIVYEPEETQQLLAALGFYDGSLDGIVGPRTRAAIEAAQQAYGFPATGTPQPELLEQLRAQWHQQQDRLGSAQENGAAALHAYRQLQGSQIVEKLAESNPCRIVTLCPVAGEDRGVSAQVSAHCPIDHHGHGSALVCCEYITLHGTAQALERAGGLIAGLMLGDLPKFLWWRATPQPDDTLFQRLASDSDLTILDSSTFGDAEADLLRVGKLLGRGLPIADLNWRRLAPWQELAAEAFDPPERRDALQEVDRVTIDHEKGNRAQALMYLGWLASRLQWQPVAYTREGGDYDIRRVTFEGSNQRTVEAELAAIPTADWGDIPGDLIDLRLSSTNLDADCCTVLCSETTGCMRMEAAGGAQACRIQQVTPLFDQKTEELLSQQLQYQRQEALYGESMETAHELLALGAD
ncbi:MAG: glucose-6-phosphate dehydrogenase assembly protein OpcA [Cyanobacteria bacterium QS_8_64_29]|nr:MAG: glucose-6-phosphate dehydrogenase assembly protein OpcA [Cyanobacteria bacterium QS_8_64_29]